MHQSATLDVPSLSPAAPRDGIEPYARHVASGRESEREIDDLRIASYRTAGHFKLPDPDAVRRRTDPDDSLCLLLRQGRVLSATVRLAYVRDPRLPRRSCRVRCRSTRTTPRRSRRAAARPIPVTAIAA
jgi:hypothetical protein